MSISSDHVEKNKIQPQDNQNKGTTEKSEDSSVEKHSLEWIEDKYSIQRKAGEGAFSVVYKAIDKSTNAEVAIKAITRTTAPTRILDELEMLKKLGGQNFCIPLLNVMRKNDQILAIFPYISGCDFKDFIKMASSRDIQSYMFCLISAVKHVHSLDYVHRDIKPSNFVYDREKEIGFLIDFGLVQKAKKSKKKEKENETPILFFNSTIKPSRPPGYYENDSRPLMKAPRAGTRGFRAPEILFKSPYQGTEIDMWSVGVVLLCILSARYPFFVSMEDLDGLVEIATIFGHAEMRKAAKLYGRVWKSNIETIHEDRVPFREIIGRLNTTEGISDELFDLLDRLLEIDGTKRITAADALKHAYFTK